MTAHRQVDYDRPSNILWLGQEEQSSFKNNNHPADEFRYRADSTNKNWPTFSFTKAHRLHTIKSLCSSCDKINITKLQESGAPAIWQESWLNIARTARKCRFCSLIAQATRGLHGSGNKRDFSSMVHSFDVPDAPLPVNFVLLDGTLDVWIGGQASWEQSQQREHPTCHLGSFDLFVEEDNALTEENVNLSVPDRSTMVPFVPIPSQKVIPRLVEQLGRLVNPSVCETCAADGESKHDIGSPWLPQDKPNMLPDRFLEIMDSPDTEVVRIRLLETKKSQVGHYIALSHRWGGKITLKTTKSTLPHCLKGFFLEDLPRTFRDAALVAKALGITYLWIDSLCIIQDDRKDWLEQSSKMGSIYMNSTFTIAAHSAGQCNEGFLWRSQVPSTLTILPQHGGPEFSVSIPEIASRELYTRFHNSEISLRAWVLQELTLSRRILHFVENRLLWECEHRTPEIDGIPLETTASMLRNALGATEGYTMWLELIQKYTDYQMTKQSDKLVALAGIKNVLQGNIERLEDRNYHCGVFEKDLERSLLWYTSDVVLKHPERAPSWSWASANGTLYFLPLELIKPPKKLIRIKEILHYDYQNTHDKKHVWNFSGITHALSLASWNSAIAGRPGCRLILEAPLIHLTSSIGLEKSKLINSAPDNAPRWISYMTKDRRLRTTYGWCIPDEHLTEPKRLIKPGEILTLSFLAVLGRVIRGELIGAWCVLVRPEDAKRGIYKRVGLGYIRDVELLMPAIEALETVILI